MRLAETYRAARRNEAKGRVWRGIPARAPRPLMGGAARRAAKRDAKQSGYAAAGLNGPRAMARRARQWNAQDAYRTLAAEAMRRIEEIGERFAAYARPVGKSALLAAPYSVSLAPVS